MLPSYDWLSQTCLQLYDGSLPFDFGLGAIIDGVELRLGHA